MFALGLNYLTCYWIFDTQARAVQQIYLKSSKAQEEEEVSTMEGKDSSRNNLETESMIDLPNPLTCWVTLEVAELVDLFLGECLNLLCAAIRCCHHCLTSRCFVCLLLEP